MDLRSWRANKSFHVWYGMPFFHTAYTYGPHGEVYLMIRTNLN